MHFLEKDIIVTNVHGLHVRPAAEFVRLASKYDSSVLLVKDNEAVDGKSIIAILSLGINNGTTIKLVVEGEDAEIAFEVLKKFLEDVSE
ncbi:MAG: HPr family phosphocarrier protein [Candidatus Omnitrophica bacterium]|nr:HPr family phosphocarrier protein [Candidatus Omnitrophota bacterium]MDD5080819.1 HPr family phosphocarrier protein [Candidatus Omnitrophota bacterium]MDD5441236.1 HPr family phosphocarrier protein [Candidatus Omnitrophota bacterium]